MGQDGDGDGDRTGRDGVGNEIKNPNKAIYKFIRKSGNLSSPISSRSRCINLRLKSQIIRKITRCL